MAVPTVTVRIDWDNDGDFTSAIETVRAIAPQGKEIQITRGRSADFSADTTGAATFLLRNDDDRYTPDRNWHDNPSFEDGTTGWSTAAIASLTAAATSIGQVTDNATAATGSKAGEAVLTGTLNSGVTYAIPYRFRSGVTYAVSVYLKSMSGNLNVRAGLASSGTPADIASSGANITTSWVQYTFTWTPSADRTDAVFFVRTTTAAAATVRIDAVQVNPGAAATTYLEGPTKGQLVPGRPVHIYATYSATDYPQFYGYIERITPLPRDRIVIVTCYDPLAAMARKAVSLPLRSRTHREIRLDALNAFGASWRNLLEANPSFETNVTGWSISSGTLTRIAGDAPSTPNAGSACAEGAITSAGYIASPIIPIVTSAGVFYRASVWAKHSSGSTTVTLRVVNESGGGLSSGALSTFTLTTGVWTRLTGTWRANGAHTGLQLRVGLEASTTVRIDAAMLTIGPEDRDFVTALGATGSLEQNFLDDPSFETKPVSVNWANLRSNYIGNPSFETDTSGWSAAGDAFIGATGGFVRSTGDFYSGVACGEFATAGTNNGIFYAITGTFKAGVTYTASAYIKVATGSSSAKFGIGSNGTIADKGQALPSINTTWTRTTVTWTPSADRTDAHLYFACTDGSSIAHRLDAVLVTEGSTAPVYGETFGYGFLATSATRVTTDASSGAASIEVVTTATNQSGVYYKSFGTRTFFAGVAYTFICSVKSVSGNTALAIGVGPESVNTDSAVSTFTATGSYVVRSVSWTPSADRTDVVAFVRMNTGAATATFRLDGCAVYPGSTVFTFEPSFISLDAESTRVPDYAGSGSVLSLLDAVNTATLTRHWVQATMTSPFWTYKTQAQASAAAAASAETYSATGIDLTGFDIDGQAIVNVLEVTPGSLYIDANGITQTNTANGIIWASDRASVAAYGRFDGPAIASELIEHKLDDTSVQQALGDALVARYKDPHPRPVATRYNAFPAQLQREVNDLITVTSTRALLVSQEYFIVRRDVSISDGGTRWQTNEALEESPY